MRSVSDHALVRYLERIAGVDLEPVRDIIRRLAAESVPEKRGDHYWHKESGTMLILGEGGRVISILSPEQARKHAGRKLRNGERIEEANP